MSVDPSVAVGDRIVVGVDGFGSSQQALRWARPRLRSAILRPNGALQEWIGWF